MQPRISLTTRQAAQYFAVAPHVLHANYRRHGHYGGIVPRKGKGGRLFWPADEVREAALPPPWEQPDGMTLWLEVVAQICPGIEPRDAYRLGMALLGSESSPGWTSLPCQSAESAVKLELPLALMIVQATADRVDCAEADGVRPAQGTLAVAAAIGRRLMRYVAGADLPPPEGGK